MTKRRSPIAQSLIKNSKSAMFSAVEIHNKPIFAYRYEVATILIVNAWELALKAYIYKNLKSVKLFKKDGRTKEFLDCLACVASNLGNDFEATKESVANLYEYRNKLIHFYCENLDSLLYSLLRANIAFYIEFLEKHFKIDLSRESNLILLPLGFTKPFSPIDFLSNSSAMRNSSKEVRAFINGIVDASRRLEMANVKDSIFVEYRMSLINEKRVSNADIVAAINNSQPQTASLAILDQSKALRLTDDPDVDGLRIDEDEAFSKIYTQEYKVVVETAKSKFKNFKLGRTFNALMKQIKKDPLLHRVRRLDPKNPRSASKDWYSKAIYDELSKYYE